MKARERKFASEAFGDELEKLLPIIHAEGSDSAMVDNAFEFFVLAGRSLAEAAMMMIPEPWTENPHISPEKKAFYQYNSTLMEPWDGPTSIAFTNGKQIGAILDRNGLRPARYYVTKDDHIIYSSEVGVIDVTEEEVVHGHPRLSGRARLLHHRMPALLRMAGGSDGFGIVMTAAGAEYSMMMNQFEAMLEDWNRREAEEKAAEAAAKKAAEEAKGE